jgi:putative phage-type endonuclease
MNLEKSNKKKYENQIIKNLDENYNKKYTLKQFDDIVIKIQEEIKDIDYKKVRKIMSKYSNYKKDKISFDTETISDFNYKNIKNLESLDKKTKEKSIELKEDKPKVSGFFNFSKKVLDTNEYTIIDKPKESKEDKIIESKVDKSKKPKEDKIIELKDKPKVSGFFNFSKKTLDTKEELKITKIKKSSDNDVSYEYPLFNTYNSIKKEEELYEPYGTQWVNDKQIHDTIDKPTESIAKIVDDLMAIDYPEQKSDEWHNLRDKRATASDGGCILGENPYEATYKFLIKKVLKPAFTGMKNCYHGCKYEQTATMIYEYRMNVKVQEFGLVAHPEYDFLAASPDGIISRYKLDGIHKTKHVGRMLEIKCVTSREIIMDGEIKDNICPIYYWIQVQLQLECCDLEECDFWQCKIIEYDDRDEFIEDTDSKEPFRSKSEEQEKGCVIQVLPKNKYEDIKSGKYMDVVYADAKYLYPPKIEMSPIECDIWIAETMANFNKICSENKLNPNEYFFDSIKYWKLTKSKCVTIKRDKEWFAENISKIEKIWNMVKYFRDNQDKSDIFFGWIESLPIKNNKKIMEFAEFMKNEPDKSNKKEYKNYTNKLLEIKEEIEKNKITKEKKNKLFGNKSK